MKLITNKYKSVYLPFDTELFEWLLITYPMSQYRVVESETTVI